MFTLSFGTLVKRSRLHFYRKKILNVMFCLQLNENVLVNISAVKSKHESSNIKVCVYI